MIGWYLQRLRQPDEVEAIGEASPDPWGDLAGSNLLAAKDLGRD
jgi:hypothetical protein